MPPLGSNFGLGLELECCAKAFQTTKIHDKNLSNGRHPDRLLESKSRIPHYGFQFFQQIRNCIFHQVLDSKFHQIPDSIRLHVLGFRFQISPGSRFDIPHSKIIQIQSVPDSKFLNPKTRHEIQIQLVWG